MTNLPTYQPKFKPADVVSYSDYYPFGMQMPGRNGDDGNSYRYGFNGMESDDEVKGTKNSYDFGARIYNPRVGRWLSVDPLEAKYPKMSPYIFVGNTPLQAMDPDGRLIIFINGMWGWPNEVTGGGTAEYWGGYSSNSWLWRAIYQISPGGKANPDKALFFDGSMGGTTPGLSWRSSLSKQDRIDAGYDSGFDNGLDIVAGLEEGETIKYVTNSMGAAFQRGHSKGIIDRVKYENAMIMVHNSKINDEIEKIEGILWLRKQPWYKPSPYDVSDEALNLKIGMLKSQKKELYKIPTIEFVIDLDPHQKTSADPNAEEHFFMQSRNYNAAEKVAVDPQPVEGAKEIKSPAGDKAMKWHHSSGAPIELLPKAKN